MKITRRPPIPNEQHIFIGALTTLGYVTECSKIEYEKGYLTAKPLWKVGDKWYYDSELTEVSLFVIEERPVVRGDNFIGPDMTTTQVAVNIVGSAIHYYLNDKNGKPLPEYEGQIMRSPLEGSYPASFVVLTNFSESEVIQVLQMKFGDIIEL